MDIALIDSETVELLSDLTDRKLSQQDLTPPVLFLSSLVFVLLGVIMTDGVITEAEEERWQKTIDKFLPLSETVHQWTQQLTVTVQNKHLYAKPKPLRILTASFSEPEKLLLISFGYEMAAADGDMNVNERRFLEAVASRLEIDSRYLAILEAIFSGGEVEEKIALDEVRDLLNPARFQALDTTFVKAASEVLALFPDETEFALPHTHQASAYTQLQQFQQEKQKLDTYCYQIYKVIRACCDRDFLPNSFIEDFEKLYKKFQSQRFRVAVVGEFSQGKSTLLNALLGEEIQPVRAIPCSGTVTVLKYGKQKQVTCCYKDGRKETIPIEQYQEKASISEAAATGSVSDELVQTEIDEIILEHPDLDLCRNGVEIVDSPGLNEHPEREAIAQKLLKNIDAIIFLTNASRQLTLSEKQIIEDLQVQIMGQKGIPLANLFIVANFMDLLRREKDRQDVRLRIENYVYGQTPLIQGENRVHFISAQAAIDAMLENKEDEYLTSFLNFTRSLESFLVFERGKLALQASAKQVSEFIPFISVFLEQSKQLLNGKIKLTESEKSQAIEQIGEASGRDFKLKQFTNQKYQDTTPEVERIWKEWLEGLEERLRKKSENWKSQESIVWSRDKLAQDYGNQFKKDLIQEIQTWVETKLRLVLKTKIQALDTTIEQELKAIHDKAKHFNRQVNTNFPEDLFSFKKIDFSVNADGWFAGGVGMAGIALALIPVIIFAGPLLTIIASASALFTGSAGLSLLGGGVEGMIKQEVFKFGYQEFVKSQSQVKAGIDKRVRSTFSDRYNAASNVIRHAISLYENLLEQQEKAYKDTLDQKNQEIAWITQKIQELEQVQQEIDALMKDL